MAIVLEQLIEPKRVCSYLPDRRAQLEMRIQVEVTATELEAMLERGWRRFGPVYFRPACQTCESCVSLRIPVDTFLPTKSQRRALKGTLRLRRTVGLPRVDDEHMRLYRRWHAERERSRGWEPSPLDAERYAFDFAFPHPAVREVSYRDPGDQRLVAVGICDETEAALSAAYFYWDPACAPSSLGVGHVVMLIADAKKAGCKHVYLGYRVLECASLAYKARYEPHELLAGRPQADELPNWR
ncbi:MAG: arginyltransferase [Polyangiaceae bacterium]|nr:arginyltransferase [Polyangiaceae bacterium]